MRKYKVCWVQAKFRTCDNKHVLRVVPLLGNNTCNGGAYKNTCNGEKISAVGNDVSINAGSGNYHFEYAYDQQKQ